MLGALRVGSSNLIYRSIEGLRDLGSDAEGHYIHTGEEGKVTEFVKELVVREKLRCTYEHIA